MYISEKYILSTNHHSTLTEYSLIHMNIFKCSSKKQKQKSTPKFIDNAAIKKWSVHLLLLNLDRYGTASTNRVEMTSYDLWGWIIKGHAASNLFTGSLSSGVLRHPVKSPTTQEPADCEEAKPQGDATHGHSGTALFFKVSCADTRQVNERASRWCQPPVIKSSFKTSYMRLQILWSRNKPLPLRSVWISELQNP